MATSGEMVLCQLRVCKFVLTADDVFIASRSDDTPETQIAQQGPLHKL